MRSTQDLDREDKGLRRSLVHRRANVRRKPGRPPSLYLTFFVLSASQPFFGWKFNYGPGSKISDDFGPAIKLTSCKIKNGGLRVLNEPGDSRTSFRDRMRKLHGGDYC
jgi:hypothetical protein